MHRFRKALFSLFTVFLLAGRLPGMPIDAFPVYSDGLSLGLCSAPAWYISTPTFRTAPSPDCPWCDCFYAEVVNPYDVDFVCNITLPRVGETYTDPESGKTGYIDQEFHDSTKVHEDWHFNYAWALAESTYGRLERWSDSYVSDCCLTEADALELAQADMAGAFASAKNMFDQEWNSDVVFEQDMESGWYLETIDGVPTFRSHVPDWGYSAVTYAQGISLSFSQGEGNCPCEVPDTSSTFVLLLTATGVLLWIRRFCSSGADPTSASTPIRP